MAYAFLLMGCHSTCLSCQIPLSRFTEDLFSAFHLFLYCRFFLTWSRLFIALWGFFGKLSVFIFLLGENVLKINKFFILNVYTNAGIKHCILPFGYYLHWTKSLAYPVISFVSPVFSTVGQAVSEKKYI